MKKKQLFSTKLLERLFYSNAWAFPFLVTTSLSFLFIESITYSGFISKFFLLNAKAFMFLSILSGTILLSGKEKTPSRKDKPPFYLVNLLFHLNYLLMPAFILIYYLMVTADSRNYPNYVFSTFHVIPDNFAYIVFLTIFTTIVGFASEKRNFNFANIFSPKNSAKLSVNKKLVITLSVVGLLVFGISNFIKTMTEAVKSNVYILAHLDDSYDQKMTKQWNFFYQYMKFVKDRVPEDAAIAIPPPERPWLSEGNSVLVRYFLYPRYLVTVEDESGSSRTPDFYFVTKGLWKPYSPSDYGWPKENISAEKIWYLDPDNMTVTEVADKDFDPSLEFNKNAWGLIKVNKEK